MGINSNAFISRFEIFFYSILISLMSGINSIRNNLTHLIQAKSQPAQNIVAKTDQVTEEVPQKFISYHWSMISQALISLVIWMILGFAAGFLVGMLNPR